MASDPKKPRLDERQPLADREEPRPEESNHDVPPARPAPRLRLKARKAVQFHVAKDAICAEEDEEPAAVRVLLLTRRWLAAFFDAADFGAAQIFFAFGQTILGKFGRWPLPLVKTAGGIAALLRLHRALTAIDVQWGCDWSNGNFALMHEWMEVASELQALPNLTAIRLTAWHLPHAYADVLLDSLPDRLVRVTTDDLRIATLLRKRRPLELVEVIVDGCEHSYVADVLRLKAPRIELALRPPDEPPRLHLLHDCGSLDRNEQLRELHVRAELFAEDGIPRALRHLRALNDHFKLVCHGASWVRLEVRADVDQVEEIAEKAKQFAEAMRTAGFRSGGDELRIFVEDEKHWQRVDREQVLEQLDWTREGEIPWPEFSKSFPTCSLVHEDVRVLIGLGCLR